MKYILFGSPRFAEILLKETLMEKHPPMALITSPDRPVGRKKIITSPPAKILAEKNDIPVYQPERLSEFDFSPLAKEADCFVVAAYARIIPLQIISLPAYGTLGVHPSLLPHLRGASPIQSTILHGESETGVTIYKMDQEVDHGPILGSAILSDYEPDLWDYATLEERLAHLGGKLLLQTMPKYLSGDISPIPQKETAATFTVKFKTPDGFISEEDLGKAVRGENGAVSRIALRKILAFSEEPGAWTILQTPLKLEKYTLPANLRIKLLKARIEDQKLILITIQAEGKKPNTISS